MYKNEILNESFEKKVLKNGLTVYLINKKDVNQFTALISVGFGSCVKKFSIDNKIYEIPLGIAHFLEHKLFTCSDGSDVSEKFSDIGVESNAYTSNDDTAYFCTGVKNHLKAIEILLDFVQDPYFTEADVVSEIDIIKQEILMYEDKPQSRLIMEMKRNLYSKNLVRYDIAGTIEEIEKITIDDLYLCYNTFYHPSNMTLVVIGDFDFDQLIDIIENNQRTKTFPKKTNYKIIHDEEDEKINNLYSEIKMEVYSPKVCLAIKLPYETCSIEEKIKNDLYVRLFLRNAFAQDTLFTQELQKNGTIYGSIKYGHVSKDNYRFIYFHADTKMPEEFISIMKEKIKNLENECITEERFELLIKYLKGIIVLSFDDLEELIFEFTNDLIQGFNYFEYLNIINQLSCAELNEKNTILKDCEISCTAILPND